MEWQLKRLSEKWIGGERKKREMRYRMRNRVEQTEKCRPREQKRKANRLKETTTNARTVKHHMYAAQTIGKYFKMNQVKKKNSV